MTNDNTLRAEIEDLIGHNKRIVAKETSKNLSQWRFGGIDNVAYTNKELISPTPEHE